MGGMSQSLSILERPCEICAWFCSVLNDGVKQPLRDSQGIAFVMRCDKGRITYLKVKWEIKRETFVLDVFATETMYTLLMRRDLFLRPQTKKIRKIFLLVP
jgi:hypothetical protein